MKIEITERKQVNALVTGLGLVAAKGMGLVIDMETVKHDASLDCDEPMTYQELADLAEYILEVWYDHTTEEPS